ncbi:hypothetical protein [Desertivirga arenae]|uniref:hypothetical protein n=1 Tax=Desertivirga arenae TaxID=2810309 RepID=UPI001A965FC3|nr:hypothetical protein [Pedobacter sp. SYSU D00823]
MENFIPFLIGIALFIYKVWSNFSKEQEKARKRNPAKSGTSEKRSVDSKRRQAAAPANVPQPFLIEEVTDTNNPYEPKYKHLYQREKRNSKEYEPKVNELSNKEMQIAREGYNPEIPAEEIKANRKIHRTHKHGEVSIPEVENPVEFDMRSAVIAEAILNRPKF